MIDATSFWWQTLKKAGDLVANVGEDIVSDKLRDQIENTLKPILKLLEDPEAPKAFRQAFGEAADEFVRQASTDDDRQLRREVVALLGRTTREGVPEASQDLIQRYVLASEPNRAPLDRWVQRQLGGNNIAVGERVYTQDEITFALDTFFRELNGAFWNHPFFRDQVSQADTKALLRHILDALRAEADIEALREDYLDYLRRHLAYLDLGGIAPKVANRTVKLPMKDIYVPVEAERELDVQQAWQQMREFLSTPFRGLPDRSFPIIGSLSLGDVEDIQAKFAVGEKTAAWHIFQERLASERPAEDPASVKDILAAPRAVLLGHPGTGKSTTLKYAAYAIATGLGDLVGEEALERLPILVRLVDYAKARSADSTLRLRDYVRDFYDKDRASLFRQCLNDGECLVMLDGLDEVINPRQRAEIADQVEALVADYPGNHYLLASRIVGYEAGWLTGDFTHFTLGPLPEASIQEFVQKWYEAIEREGGIEASEEAQARADELCKAIEDRPGIRRLAENPLLLTIIALVNWKGRKLPNRRVEVYRHAAETLVESWPRVRRGVIFDGEEVLSLLEPVAYRIFSDRSSEEMAESDLLPLLTQAVVEIKPGMTEAAAREYVADLLPRLSEHSGFFLERGLDAESGERVFGFLHLTFAEYLAARYLVGQWEAEKGESQRRTFLARYAHVPRWREVVLLAAEQVGLDGRRVPATQVLADLLQMETPYEQYLHRNLLLAGQCLADDLRVEPPAAEWVLDQMTTLILETPIRPLREQITALAQHMAGTTYGGRLANCLLARLEDESESVRYRAAVALGGIKSKWAVEVLLARLEDESESVRNSAAVALGRIGDERAVEVLLARLEDESESVRDSAAVALGRIGDERAVGVLLARLKDESESVRDRVAWALGEIRSERAEEGLLARLEDESESVRDRAAWALGRIGDERAEEGLLARLEDESERVRDRAVWALGEIKSERAVEGLLARLEDESEGVRDRAAWALERIGDERAVAGLLARLGDESESVRDRVALALEGIKSERAVEGLLAKLEDESESVRDRATVALGRIGGEGAVEGLLTRLEDESESVRTNAAVALGGIKSGRAVEGLLARLEDESESVRYSAAVALGRIGDKRAAEGLLAQLEDESDRVRYSAAVALGRIGGERAVEGLLVRLEDESESMRDSAAVALGGIKSERAVEGLLARLEDESESVRDSAAVALGRTGDERAVEGLLARLEDESESVRDRATVALGRIGDERAVEGLLARLEDESESVRDKAAVALGEIKSERAVEGLLARLEDESESVRDSAAVALGRTGDERAVEGLLARLEDESESVRDSAVVALGGIKSERGVEGLLAWLSRSEYRIIGGRPQITCNWTYTTILEILAHHAPDPGVVPSPPGQEPVISGPWSE